MCEHVRRWCQEVSGDKSLSVICHVSYVRCQESHSLKRRCHMPGAKKDFHTSTRMSVHIFASASTLDMMVPWTQVYVSLYNRLLLSFFLTLDMMDPGRRVEGFT